ncbi:hypothetical protein [Streptomyces sp. NBC_00316]|uniref:hypothetical protein n=1 Tax=Streptomyces sp. NBC_00316 TaxID=2975710 RepID=UPI003FA6DDE5
MEEILNTGFGAERDTFDSDVDTQALRLRRVPVSVAASVFTARRLMLMLESLESRFAEHDGFLHSIAEKRTEIYDAFTARKQPLQDARARRAEPLAESARRWLLFCCDAATSSTGACAKRKTATTTPTAFPTSPRPVRGLAARGERAGCARGVARRGCRARPPGHPHRRA